ncbi:protein of unknown function {DUF4405} [Geoglobus ahangari]|uniref:Flavinylation-associated cytochrome domain-containing protein n=1 Tax=Geoglobus ahangari TaxID=113653 RepID=A0A0F7IEY3_9EURY|nr:DUF4405 domain-containing protein [Geoglobus ahangari]AKG91584.1 protein of unknown function {DUF4405} [Geoglobus ahangari]
MSRRSLRAAVDVLLVIGFVVILVTGIGLYFAPSGRIAKETGWTWMGMDKETLEEVHTYFGFSMVAVGLVHLFLNYRAMYYLLKHTVSVKRNLAKISVAVALMWSAGSFTLRG